MDTFDQLAAEIVRLNKLRIGFSLICQPEGNISFSELPSNAITIGNFTLIPQE